MPEEAHRYWIAGHTLPKGKQGKARGNKQLVALN
jgi:hypothetical protein